LEAFGLPLSIRPFTREDLPRVSEIEVSIFPNPWPESFFTYNHEKAPDLFLVAVHEGRIVGYVVGEMREIMFSGVPHQFKMGHILNIAVDTGCRRMGVGTRLIDTIEDRFRERNASKVTLEVRESNSSARAFYQRRGYEEIGRVRAYYPDEDAVIMSKDL